MMIPIMKGISDGIIALVLVKIAMPIIIPAVPRRICSFPILMIRIFY